MIEFTVLFPFAGIGGGAMGFADAEATLFGQRARFRSIGGIDIDDGACRDFVALTGSPALTADIAELTPEQLRDFAGEKAPDVVFLSAPCVGSSKLISDAKAQEPKYRALNKLSEIWIDLMLATWGKAPPGLVLFENVPNLTTRAKAMLGRVKKALRAAGYVLHDGYHCAGEIGGLAQRRRRWLMVARHAATVPPLLYQPTKKRVRGCGEVIGPLPMPGDPAGGAMHALPKISWLNWVRLALIPAGGDWRDLPGVLDEGQKRRTKFKRHEVCAWDKPCGTVGGSGSNGVENIADARLLALTPSKNRHDAKYAVGEWDKPSKTVTSATRPGSGSLAVNDPRVPKAFPNGYGVQDWSAPAGTVTGEASVSNGASVADPRRWFRGVLGVTAWNEPAGVVTASSAVSRGPFSVADPRPPLLPSSAPFDAAYGVLSWTDPSRTVAGGSDVGQGAYAVADVRLRCRPRAGAYGVLPWQEAAKTITAAACHDNGPFAIADTRIPGAVPLCVVKDIRKAPIGGVPVILAADGTWHRPLTTLELAVLQGFPAFVGGKPLQLAGTNSTEWRRRVGNAVPPPAARAIAERMLTNLLGAASGAFMLSGDGAVWVAPKKTRGRVEERARVRVGPRALRQMERAAMIGASA